MLYHNLIWDFDGTLFDSYPHICASYLQALADFGRTADPDILMAKLKINFGEAHKYLDASDALRKRFAQYEHDIDFAPVAVLYNGMKELLADTRAAGVRHFLFTHRNNLALTYMERAGILGYFDGWVTSDDKEHFALKPSPASIQYLLEHYGIDPHDCAMIGDREIDVGSGIAAGTNGILFDEFHNLGETKAQHRVYSVEEMRELLLGE